MANPSDGVTICRVGGIPNGTAPIHLSFGPPGWGKMPILPSTIAVDQMGFTQIFKSVGDYGEQEEAERS